MLTIRDGGSLARALSFPLQPSLAELLKKRYQQLSGDMSDTAFVVIQPLDRSRFVEECLGWSVLQNPGDGTRYGDPDYSPGFEWIEDHGFCFELTFEFTTDFTHVLFVEKAKGVDRQLLNFCAAYASEHA
jgi:hypothetical protein